MSKENQTLSYDEIMEELAQLCHAKSTGTLFIVSDKGHSSRMSLKEGTILFFAYRTHKGLDALFDLYDMVTGKYHFSKGVYNPYNVLDLPNTVDLLYYFKHKTFPQEGTVKEKKESLNSTVIHSSLDKVTTTTSKKSAPNNAAPKKAVQAEYQPTQVTQIINQIEASLVNYLGPFADISIHDYLADNKTPDTQEEFRKMMDFLTLEIDDREDQTTFKNEIITIISQ
ncbi:MAG: DUF4388 domain-containing protein [Gammaproteobacteria bacterium]|nr:DUF4388 domain-containing protein [Gammaproteobacteria bacterium]